MFTGNSGNLLKYSGWSWCTLIVPLMIRRVNHEGGNDAMEHYEPTMANSNSTVPYRQLLALYSPQYYGCKVSRCNDRSMKRDNRL
jgi:hypothetical protein